MNRNNIKYNIHWSFSLVTITTLLLSFSCNAYANEFTENFIRELSINKEITIAGNIVLRVKEIKKNNLLGIVYEQIKPNNVKLLITAPKGKYDIISDIIEFHLYDGRIQQYNDKGEGFTIDINEYNFKVSKTQNDF